MNEQVAEIAETVPAKHHDLVVHRVRRLHLVQPGGEHVVPEEGDLLLERARRVDHAVQPVHLRVLGGGDVLGHREVAEEQGLVDIGLRLRGQQLLDGCLIALGDEVFQLIVSGPEARPPHEVRHQSDFLTISHRMRLLKVFVPLSTRTAHTPTNLDKDCTNVSQATQYAGRGFTLTLALSQTLQ